MNSTELTDIVSDAEDSMEYPYDPLVTAVTSVRFQWLMWRKMTWIQSVQFKGLKRRKMTVSVQIRGLEEEDDKDTICGI